MRINVASCINQIVESVRPRKIICWGLGKFFYSQIVPLLSNYGLLDNLICVIDSDEEKRGSIINLNDKRLSVVEPMILEEFSVKETVLIISTVHYVDVLDVMERLHLDDREYLIGIFLVNLFKDYMMLEAKKPPIGYRKINRPCIPNIIHTFWFSDDVIPDEYQACLASWKKYCADYEIRIWNLKDYSDRDCPFFNEAIDMKKWAFASDYARADVVYRYGGIYMDLDVEVIRPLDDLLYNECYMGFESLDYIDCGSGFGASSGHDIVGEIRETYRKTKFILADGSINTMTCPQVFTEVLLRHGLKQNGGFQNCDGITIYPAESLTAKSEYTGLIHSTEHTYTIHHHRGSWLDKEVSEGRNKAYRRFRDMMDRFAKSDECLS